jgi:hypothetical protein
MGSIHLVRPARHPAPIRRWIGLPYVPTVRQCKVQAVLLEPNATSGKQFSQYFGKSRYVQLTLQNIQSLDNLRSSGAGSAEALWEIAAAAGMKVARVLKSALTGRTAGEQGW